MDLVPALPLPAALNPANSERSATSDATGLELAGADAEHRRNANSSHFADILGQTLAGPLFATWTPTAEVIATNKPAANQAQMTALDPNGRREGRKRSRR